MLHKMSLDYMYTVNDEILQTLRAKGKKKHRFGKNFYNYLKKLQLCKNSY